MTLAMYHPEETRISDTTTRHLRTAAFILGLAAVYFCAGIFGLSLASVNPSASAVWPPSGIALTAILLWGYRLWPGVFLGATLVNFAVQRSLATALAIAAGNTLEALFGAWLVCRFAEGPKAFKATKNILLFILLAAALSTTVGATVGVTSLTLAGHARWDDYLAIWLTWWLGDMVGDLIVASPLVLWMTQPLLPLKVAQILEATGLLLTLSLVGWVLFLNTIPSGLEYFALVPLLWGALRFGRRGAATSALIMSGIALWGTSRNLGPFATLHPNHSLLLLQVFMATIATTALVMASVVSERRRLEQRLLIKDAVSRILAESPALAEAAPRIIQVLCERGGWGLGAIWDVDRTPNQLTCMDFWSLRSVNVPEFEAVTRLSKFGHGIGLPGRVWASGEPAWILDVTKDSNFPRAPAATKEGLHSAFCFPIKLTDEVLGVIECMSREVREPDEDFLEMVSDIGLQFGQFIERKRAEKSLRAKESQLRLITDSAPVMLVQCNSDGRYLFVNREYAERFGLTPEQIIGKTLPEVLGQDAYEVIRTHVQRALQGDLVQYEVEVPYERIGRRFMRIAYVPEKDRRGKVTGWISAISDITDRKRAEQALRESEERLRIGQQAARWGVFDYDYITGRNYWSPEIEALYGLAPGEFEGTYEGWHRRLHPEDRERVEAEMDHALETGEYSQDFRVVWPDGSVHWLFARAKVFTGAGGRPLRISGVNVDISERKLAEAALLQAKDALAQSNAELERRVQERTAELERANTALLSEMEEEKRLEEQLRQSQKLESIGTLTGGIAHDFNNILNIIRGHASFIGEDRSKDEELQRALKIIDEAVDRGTAIVQQLLAIARRSEARLEQLNLNDLVKNLERLLSETFPKTIDVGLHLDPGSPSLTADPSQIDQVLLNISLNARDAMPEGGKLVLTTGTVPGAELRARFQEVKAEQYALISVADTGLGMDEAVKSRIFEPFFSTKHQDQGTGLGLSVAYGIVANHGGFIDVTSRPHEGSTFNIYLPIGELQGQQLESKRELRSEHKEIRAQGQTILFVEDEVRQVQLMQNFLQRNGYRVLTAINGLEAVDIHLRHKDEISIVVLDLGLPGLSGWEAFQRMKQANPNLKAILATGYIAPEIASAATKGELTAVIMKPYQLSEILKVVSSAALMATGAVSAAD